MLTTCKEELPNPYKDCVREIIEQLICHDNDFRRLNYEMRQLQQEFKQEMHKIEFKCAEIRKPVCAVEDKIPDFTQQILSIDQMNECFNKKIEDLEAKRQELIRAAKVCAQQLKVEKCKLKQFHEKTIDHLKRTAIRSDDPLVINNCEKDICEMSKLFVKEVATIRRCEMELLPFLKQLDDGDLRLTCDCCCLREYDWLPKGQSLKMVDDGALNMKETVGATLRKAFAQMFVKQPADPKSFLAAFLTNMESNERTLQEKLILFGAFQPIE